MKLLIVDFTPSIPLHIKPRGRPLKKKDNKMKMFISHSETLFKTIKFKKPIQKLEEIRRMRPKVEKPNTQKPSQQVVSTSDILPTNQITTENNQVISNTPSPVLVSKPRIIRTSISLKDILN